MSQYSGSSADARAAFLGAQGANVTESPPWLKHLEGRDLVFHCGPKITVPPEADIIFEAAPVGQQDGTREHEGRYILVPWGASRQDGRRLVIPLGATVREAETILAGIQEWNRPRAAPPAPPSPAAFADVELAPAPAPAQEFSDVGQEGEGWVQGEVGDGPRLLEEAADEKEGPGTTASH